MTTTVDVREELFQRLLASLTDVPGCIVECGVAGGYSLAMLARHGKGRTVYGFDVWRDDVSIPLQSYERQGPPLYQPSVVIRSVQALLVNSAPDADVRLVHGLFAHTLPATSTGAIALLHIDADVYHSYRDVLVNLWPRMALGGIVVFDEYHATEKWPGAKQAVDEYLAGKPHALVNDVRWYARRLAE